MYDLFMFDVWLEGYRATGEKSEAQFVGTYKAKNFLDACHIAAMDIAHGDFHDFYKYYSINNNTWWARQFFDNEEDARKVYG